MNPTSASLPPDSCKVYTPRALADAMVAALRPARGMTWLEPCVGRGVFLTTLANAGVPRRNIVAIDLDSEDCDVDSLADTHRGEDFFSWSQATRKQFDRIVGNPPFISLSQLDPQLRDASSTIQIPNEQQTVPLNSNTWFAFLCSCLQLLREGGGIAFVLPAAWDYARYATLLRERIPTLFREFFTFRSQRPLFDQVQEGAIVIVGRGYQLKHAYQDRVECRDREHLISSISSICEARDLVAAKPVLEKKDGDHLGIPLGDMVDIRLGGVTGHAEYFLMTEPQREALRLPPEAVYPVLSRSRHLKSAMIDHRLWLKLLREGERVWLFRPTNDIVSHPAVIDYLSRSKRSGGCNRKRYKIKQRTPWYLTPLPDHVDGFLSGMTKLGPWIALCRMEGLNATNTLYVVRFKGKKDACSKSAIALAMLTSTVRETLGRRCRRYPDGLIKHEPGDLMSVRVPVAKDPRGASAVYSGAVTSLLKGNVVEATSRADRFFNL